MNTGAESELAALQQSRCIQRVEQPSTTEMRQLGQFYLSDLPDIIFRMMQTLLINKAVVEYH